MARFAKITGVLGALAAVVTALPVEVELASRNLDNAAMVRRQINSAANLGITDVDVLQFALTLEWLESTFYAQGFEQFSDDQFASAGLTAAQITDLKSIGTTENSHVSLLQSAIAAAGVQPVQPCTYDFTAAFADPGAMLSTAGVLEQVGMSAYLGAAPLLTEPTTLATAGSILTTEARHQTFIRVASGAAASPSTLDTALGPRAVFSLASPFIQSCPEGSNLVALTAFSTLTMTSPQASAAGVTALAEGTQLSFQSDANAQAQFCGFTNSAAAGLTAFAPFDAASGSCALPPNLSGIVYVTLTNSEAADGVLTDDITVAGPMVLQLQ